MTPADGVWNMRYKKFNAPTQLQSWAIFSMCQPNRCALANIQSFFGVVMDQMNKLGMSCPRTPPRFC